MSLIKLLGKIQNIIQHFVVLSYLHRPQAQKLNYCVGKVKLITLHALFGN